MERVTTRRHSGRDIQGERIPAESAGSLARTWKPHAEADPTQDRAPASVWPRCREGCFAKQIAQPGQQFSERKRLGEVVVSTLLQAAHSIVDGPARREDQHRAFTQVTQAKIRLMPSWSATQDRRSECHRRPRWPTARQSCHRLPLPPDSPIMRSALAHLALGNPGLCLWSAVCLCLPAPFCRRGYSAPQ